MRALGKEIQGGFLLIQKMKKNSEYSLPSAASLALGKEVPLPSANFDTRQSIFIFVFKNFLWHLYNTLKHMFQFGTFYDFLVYFLNFLCLLEFFSKK